MRIGQFQKGNPPPAHKAECGCFRCSGEAWNKGIFGIVKQSEETIAKRVAKLKGHRPFKLPKFSADEQYLKKLARNKHRLALRRIGHTEEEWEMLKKIHGYMCLCCKRVEPEITLTRDHIKPISKGGTDEIENIQPLCGDCNNRKFTKSISYLPSAIKYVKEIGGDNN